MRSKDCSFHERKYYQNDLNEVESQAIIGSVNFWDEKEEAEPIGIDDVKGTTIQDAKDMTEGSEGEQQ